MDHEMHVAISATEEAIWAVLTDVERWPEWTASVEHVALLDDEPFGPGSKVRIKQPRLPSLVWEVTEFDNGRSFTWVTSRGGISTTAEHVIGNDDGEVGVTLRLRQSGPLALLTVPFAALTRRYVEMEGLGLKHRCETTGGRGD